MLLAASTFVWVFILLPLVLVWVIAVLDIFRRDLSGWTKVAWIAVVLLLPFVGTLVYFLMRKPTAKEIRLHQAASADLRPGYSRAGTRPPPPLD